MNENTVHVIFPNLRQVPFLKRAQIVENLTVEITLAVRKIREEVSDVCVVFHDSEVEFETTKNPLFGREASVYEVEPSPTGQEVVSPRCGKNV